MTSSNSAASTREQTSSTVVELLTRIGAGDPDRIAELYADHVEWLINWPEGDYADTVPWIRERHDRAGVREHYRLLAEHHLPEGRAADIASIMVDGEDAVVVGTLRNTARATGRSYQAAFALHLTVRDGRITRHHVYEDSLAVADAFGYVSGRDGSTGSNA